MLGVHAIGHETRKETTGPGSDYAQKRAEHVGECARCVVQFSENVRVADGTNDTLRKRAEASVGIDHGR